MKGAHGLLLILMLSNCTPKQDQSQESNPPVKGTFAYDRNFLEQHKKIHVLKSGDAQVIVVGDYQGRVMTSTANGDAGTSFGWINYDLIASGQLKPHMNALGGEDRFWMGPEGGQYSIFFPKGSKFEFEHWQTPPLIDTDSFEELDSDSLRVSFMKRAKLINYQGFEFDIQINRQISLLERAEAEKEFGIALNGVRSVCYQSSNSIVNTGDKDWSMKTGVLSIWILGMFIPSSETSIVIPYTLNGDATNVTDDYFGQVPADRLLKTQSFSIMKADGKYRSKIGVVSDIAKNVAGSYAADKRILTLVKFDLDTAARYVNSKWEIQTTPFVGDAVNAYNDGPLADGSQMGPFYEIESSSPGRELKKGEKVSHRSITLHLEGSEKDLDEIAQKTLGVPLIHITGAFKK